MIPRDLPNIARLLVLGLLLAPAGTRTVAAQQVAEPQAPKRPTIHSDRWQEDWSVLADPALRTEPFDALKYIPLGSDPGSYVSFGANLRERFESNDAPRFGIGGSEGDSYLLQRLQVHADIRLFGTWQIFTQLEDVRAPGKEVVGPADANELDLRLAFLGYQHEFDDGTFRARIGRQEFDFDLQRFVSSREGLNVRQAFDAVWAEWEASPWRFRGFISQPVIYHDDEPFDDASSSDFRFSAFRVDRQLPSDSHLSLYYALYQRDDAVFIDASGDEERHVLDLRYGGRRGGFDWDLEAMGQSGTVGEEDIRAWAAGARVGYTFADAAWQPRVGLQVDMASGDGDPEDGTIATFNPLFPNGSYFNLAGYTGYSNLVHVKPSLTLKPTETLTLMAAVGLQWRETTADAVYVSPATPLSGTAGKGDSWTGFYTQLRADYAINANLSAAAEYVHFDVGDAIRNAGGHDSDYFGAEFKFAW